MCTLSAGVWVECDQFVYKLLKVRFIGVAYHTKCWRPLHAVRSPAPLLSSHPVSGQTYTKTRTKKGQTI